MLKTAEKNLSFILAISTFGVFLLTLAGMFFNNVMISLIWNLVFLLSWILMVVFGLVVFFDKDPYYFSILTGIVTGFIFIILASHSVLILSNFVGNLSGGLILPRIVVENYNQKIFYTSLILTYFIHVFNYMRLNSKAKVENIPVDLDDTVEKNDFVVDDKDLEILNSHKADDDLFILGQEDDLEGGENE